MEQAQQPRGDAGEITSQYGEASGQYQPITFAEAETHNAFALLGELRDHAMALRLEDKPAEFHLTELALSAAVVAWWSRWQPLTMHRAFMAGASLADVAAAAGTSEAEAYQRWNDWAERQSELIIAGRRSVEPDEVAAVRLRYAIRP